MGNQDKLRADQVRVASISPDKNGDNVRVIFRIEDTEIEYPVVVSRREFSDEKIIRVARHYLHYQIQEMAEATRAWHLDEVEYDRLKVHGTSDLPATTET